MKKILIYGIMILLLCSFASAYSRNGVVFECSLDSAAVDKCRNATGGADWTSNTSAYIEYIVKGGTHSTSGCSDGGCYKFTNDEGLNFSVVDTVAHTQYVSNTGVFTISLWVNRTDYTSATQGYVMDNIAYSAANNGHYIVYVAASDEYQYANRGGSGSTYVASGANSITNNNWHHLLITGDGTTMTFYLDGVYKAEAAQTLQVANTVKGWILQESINYYGDSPPQSSYDCVLYLDYNATSDNASSLYNSGSCNPIDWSISTAPTSVTTIEAIIGPGDPDGSDPLNGSCEGNITNFDYIGFNHKWYRDGTVILESLDDELINISYFEINNTWAIIPTDDATINLTPDSSQVIEGTYSSYGDVTPGLAGIGDVGYWASTFSNTNYKEWENKTAYIYYRINDTTNIETTTYPAGLYISFNSLGAQSSYFPSGNITADTWYKLDLDLSNPNSTTGGGVDWNSITSIGIGSKNTGAGNDYRVWFDFFHINSNYSSNTPYNISTLDPTYTSGADEIIFSCEAVFDGFSGGWVNSSTVTVDYNLTLNVSFYDEINKSMVNKAVLVELIGDNYSNNATTSAGWQGYSRLIPGQYIIRSSGSGYTAKNYYIELEENNSYTVNIYMSKSSNIENVTATVYNQIGEGVEGAYIKVLRYDIDTNTYLTTEIAKTNWEGETYLHLTLNDEFYKFMLYYPLDVLKQETSPSYIYATSLNFQIQIGNQIAEEFKNSQGISYSLIYNNVTNNFMLTYSDSYNLLLQACLVVYDIEDNKQDEINSSCLSETSGSILIPIDNSSGNAYDAKFYAYWDLSYPYFMENIIIQFKETSPTGKSGLMIMVLLTLVFVSIARWDKSLALIVTPLPLMIGSVLNWINLNLAVAIGIEAVAIILAIVISRR